MRGGEKEGEREREGGKKDQGQGCCSARHRWQGQGRSDTRGHTSMLHNAAPAYRLEGGMGLSPVTPLIVELVCMNIMHV